MLVAALMDKDDSPEALIGGGCFRAFRLRPSRTAICIARQHTVGQILEAQMPLYTTITEQDFVTDETKARIAEEITRIHSTVMKVPRSFVRVVFLSYPQHSGYAAGEEAPTAALNCFLRSGHTVEEKTDLLKQLWSTFQNLTGIATEQLAISLQEVPSSNAMEMGQIMPAVSHE